MTSYYFQLGSIELIKIKIHETWLSYQTKNRSKKESVHKIEIKDEWLSNHDPHSQSWPRTTDLHGLSNLFDIQIICHQVIEI